MFATLFTPQLFLFSYAPKNSWWGGGGWGGGGWGGGWRHGIWGGGWNGGGWNNGWGGGYGSGWGGGWGGGGGWGRRHRGYWWDVSDGSRITDEKKACTLYIEQYADEAVPANQLDEYIRKKFVGDASTNIKSAKVRQAQQVLKQRATVDQSEQLAPFVFQCCHVEFGKELLKNPTSLAATQYTSPPLPKGATCKTLTHELYLQLAGKA